MRRSGMGVRLAGLLCLSALMLPGAAAPNPPSAPVSIPRPANVGRPLGSVELRVPEAKTNAFLSDLADFADTYQLAITGDPANMVVDGRPALLVWFTRPDGLAVLVTDATEAQRMQAFFYVGPGGFARNGIIDIMRGYKAKMSGYPAYTRP